MYTFTETEIGIMLVVFGYALYFTWTKASEKAYEIGYGDACYDVAKGNITVSLTPPSEMD
jgi:hypothetical protein